MKSFFSAIGHHYKKVKKLIPESTIILVAGKGDLTLRQVVEEEEIERVCVKEVRSEMSEETSWECDNYRDQGHSKLTRRFAPRYARRRGFSLFMLAC